MKQTNTIKTIEVYDLAFDKCNDGYKCVKDYLSKDSVFNENGFISEEIGIYQVEE